MAITPQMIKSPRSMTTHVPVLIIGAGISGLVCAHSLRKSGIDAIVVESSGGPGGLIRSERRDGYLLELGPQSFSSTPQLFELCGDLGIRDQLVEASPRAPRFLLIDGRLRQAPLNPPAFFASSLFSAKTKWALLHDAFGRTTPPNSPDESIAAFTRRKFTSELLDRFVGPFVSGIYAGDPEKLSLRATFRQVYEAERSAGSVIRGMMRSAKSKPSPRREPTLQSFRDGNETLVKALAATLGAALRTGTSATEISLEGSINASVSPKRFHVSLSAKDSAAQIIADNLVLATPAGVAAALLRPISADLFAALNQIEYAPVAVVSLGYPKSAVAHNLNGFGFLIPRSEKLRTLGTVWNSSLFPNRAPADHVLLTSFAGGATDPAITALPAGEIVALLHRELAPILQIQSPPVFSNVMTCSRALPQYNLGHSERVAAIRKLIAELPNAFLTGNYFSGSSIGACIEQALSVASEISARIAQTVQGG